MFQHLRCPVLFRNKLSKGVRETNKGLLGHSDHRVTKNEQTQAITSLNSAGISADTNALLISFFSFFLLQNAPVADIKLNFHTLLQQATVAVTGDRLSASTVDNLKKKKKKKQILTHLHPFQSRRPTDRPSAASGLIYYREQRGGDTGASVWTDA